MSHHLGYKLTSGDMIYVDWRTPIVTDAIRRVNRSLEAHQEPPLADVQLIHRYARQCPDRLCSIPFDACDHAP